MPIPKPHKGELRKEFFSRCMGDKVMVKEFTDQKQRGGVCGTAWNKRQKNVLNISSSFISNFTICYKKEKEEEFIIIPIIALVEGVHNGSAGNNFYPCTEISNTAKDWNGVPLTIGHPVDDKGDLVRAFNNAEVLEKYSVGTFENVEYKNGKLKGEGRINKNRIQKISPKALDRLSKGLMTEVSTGLLADGDGIEGMWKGEPYNETLSNFRPDHLALLPDDIGACSLMDGCGVRMNKLKNKKRGGDVKVNDLVLDKKDVVMNSENESITVKAQIVIDGLKNLGFVVNELDHSNIWKCLSHRIGEMDKPGVVHFVKAIFNDYFIFEKVATALVNSESRLFKLSYFVNKDDEVEIEGEPVEVKEKTEFISINNFRNRGGNNKMTRNKEIDSIIANKHLPIFDEESRQELEAMEESKFEGLVVLSNKLLNCKDCNTDDLVKANAKIESLEKEVQMHEHKKAVTFEELLATANSELRETIESGIKINKEKKSSLIKSLIENKRNKFSKEALETKGIEELEYLCSLGAVEINYSGQGSKLVEEKLKANERHSDGSGVPDMPVIDWSKIGAKA